jgi:hypothetical protein
VAGPTSAPSRCYQPLYRRDHSGSPARRRPSMKRARSSARRQFFPPTLPNPKLGSMVRNRADASRASTIRPDRAQAIFTHAPLLPNRAFRAPPFLPRLQPRRNDQQKGAPSPCRCSCRVDRLLPKGFQRRQRAALIGQAGVADRRARNGYQQPRLHPRYCGRV